MAMIRSFAEQRSRVWWQNSLPYTIVVSTACCRYHAIASVLARCDYLTRKVSEDRAQVSAVCVSCDS